MRVGSIVGVLGGLLLLAGCASRDVAERISFVERIANKHHFSRVDVQTSHFDLTAFIGPQTPRGILHVYIEGDGFAWVTRHQPSRNPTPIDPVAFQLAVLDSQDAVYLARPCQYIAVYERECDQRYWTSGRFAPEVIDAMDEAITLLKRKSGHGKLVLIGYSGGGAIAALVAARRADVMHLVTVAGNLDHKAWARLHAIPELRGSLNPSDYGSKLAGVRQTHFVGQRDSVVPVEVYRSYRAALPDDANIVMKIVPDADHGCCWESVWPELLRGFR